MKNVTLSIPDDLLDRARKYAQERGTTLNQMIRDLLKEEVDPVGETIAREFQEAFEKYQIKGDVTPMSRDEIYDR